MRESIKINDTQRGCCTDSLRKESPPVYSQISHYKCTINLCVLSLAASFAYWWNLTFIQLQVSMKELFVPFVISPTNVSQRHGLNVGLLQQRKKLELILINCNSHVTNRSTGLKSFTSSQHQWGNFPSLLDQNQF